MTWNLDRKERCNFLVPLKQILNNLDLEHFRFPMIKKTRLEKKSELIEDSPMIFQDEIFFQSYLLDISSSLKFAFKLRKNPLSVTYYLNSRIVNASSFSSSSRSPESLWPWFELMPKTLPCPLLWYNWTNSSTILSNRCKRKHILIYFESIHILRLYELPSQNLDYT